MLRVKSNQTAIMSELLAQADLTDRGWNVLQPISRDSPYDLVVELNGAVFNTIQVKSITARKRTMKTTNRSRNAKEAVSTSGKQRNCFSYAELGIHWMVAVDIIHRQFYYYPLDIYRRYDVINVDKVPAQEFPVNNALSSIITKTTTGLF